MAKVSAIPMGQEGILPHLVVDGGAKAIEFYKKAFGAVERFRMPSPDGRLMHAEIQIDRTVVYIADSFPEYGGDCESPKKVGGNSVVLHRYVEDVDAAIEKARKAGAEVTMPPADMFWGDRYGKIKDPFGHVWSLATHKQDLTPEQIGQAAAKAMG